MCIGMFARQRELTNLRDRWARTVLLCKNSWEGSGPLRNSGRRNRRCRTQDGSQVIASYRLRVVAVRRDDTSLAGLCVQSDEMR
jgi:hypothetical protein